MKKLPSRRKLSLRTETIRLMGDLPLSGLRTIQGGYAPAPTEYPWESCPTACTGVCGS